MSTHHRGMVASTPTADAYESILGMNVAVLTRSGAIARIAEWIGEARGRYVCVSNVHMCMESRDNAEFRAVVNEADLTVPDGLPLVWAQRLLGRAEATQVRGEDLTLDLCAYAENKHIPIGVFGGTPELISRLRAVFRQRFPTLQLAYVESPPFRPATAEEDRRHILEINKSGAKILFVGLGCPKQERWMAAHRDHLAVVLLGVGAALDFIAVNKKAAPRWMQRIGLEWLFRLACEPRRLWKRYFKHNPRFLWHLGTRLVAKQRTGTR